MVGLAYRARRCSTGKHTIVKDIQNKRAKLLLIASDISAQTKKKYVDKCQTNDIPYVEVADRNTLGNAMGKHERVAVAILDDGFAKRILSLLL